MITIEQYDYNTGITNAIDCIGDSLTEGAGATSGLTYVQQLSNYLGNTRFVKNQGIGGQTKEQIAARQGALPINITVTGNAFNGTNSVNITNISIQFLSTPAQQNTTYMSGFVNGVACVITRTATVSTETYTIQASNSSTQAIPANSTFYPDVAWNSRENIQIWWWGRNNVVGNTLSDLPVLYDNAITNLLHPRRFLILGILNAQNEGIGTTNYNNITAVNNLIKTAYPNNYIEVLPPSPSELTEINYTLTGTDAADIANNKFPASMFFDNIHLNSFGYKIIALRVYKKLKELNWN